MTKIAIGCEPAPLQAVIDELLAELANCSVEVGQMALRRFEALDHVARIESRGFAAAGAGVCLVVFHASDSLLGLLAAVRAGDLR